MSFFQTVCILGCATNGWLFEAHGDGAHLASAIILGLVVLLPTQP